MGKGGSEIRRPAGLFRHLSATDESVGLERAGWMVRGRSLPVVRITPVSDSVEDLWNEARSGRLTRRNLLRRGAALGLSAPVIATLLAACGGDDDNDTESSGGEATTAPSATEPPATEAESTATAEEGSPEATTNDASPTAAEEEPTEPSAPAAEAGGGGQLRILQWQAPTMLNPHLATGYKDYDASRIAYQPLADFTREGEPVPVLAAEFPTLANGGVAEDGLSVTWKLREGVTWHDGTPFTSKDVKFTWEYATDPDTASVTSAVFAPIESIDTPDDYTVTITFAEPNPAGFEIFTGRNGMIIPEHIFRDFMGTESRNAEANLKPVGTGPFVVTEFRPGDVVLYDRYEGYWEAGKPFFDSVELKGGGDALSATRAVLQTGEADWAWGAGGDPKVIAELEKETAGKLTKVAAITGDKVVVQFADPNTEVDGARAEPGTHHPLFQHLEARQAIALCVPRDVIAAEVYGNGAVPTSNNLVAPPRFNSPNTTWEFNIDKARELLAGIPEAADYKLLFQTSVSSTRQKAQEVVKQYLEQVGFEVELKSVDAAVFFSADAGNPDTYTKFYADLEIFTYAPDSLYPIGYMRRYATSGIAQKSNSWGGLNVTRYSNPEYDALHEQAKTEMDPDTQNDLFIKMNDISVNDVVEIPMVIPQGLTAAAADLTDYNPTSWTGPYWDIQNWRREG